MLPFYAVGKQIELPLSKKRIVIKRPGVGFYFRFLFLLIELSELSKSVEKTKDLEPKARYLKVYETSLRIKQKTKEMGSAIEPLMDTKWYKIKKQEDRDYIVKSILDFNRYDRIKGTSSEIKKDDLEKELEFILYFFSERGYTLDSAAENITYFQACAMLEQYKNDRIVKMNDQRIATQASGDEYKKIIHKMSGIKELTAEEIRKLADG